MKISPVFQSVILLNFLRRNLNQDREIIYYRRRDGDDSFVYMIYIIRHLSIISGFLMRKVKIKDSKFKMAELSRDKILSFHKDLL